MYTPWLKATQEKTDGLPPRSFGGGLRPRARKIAVAIVGLDAEVAEKTRHHLYRTVWNFDKLVVRDLGNVRKQTTDFIIPLLRELHGAGILPLLIGADARGFVAQYLAFAEMNRQVSLLHVDSRVELSPTAPDAGNERLLDAALYRKTRQFHLTHLAGQQHLIDPDILNAFGAADYEVATLGSCKDDLTRLEPLVRDADLFGLNVRALHHQDAPARAELQPSGLTLQEASQLAYYAGNSDKMSSFGVFGLDPKAPETYQELTAAAQAQLIWYFLQGFHGRVGDFPATSKGLTEYIVDIEGFSSLTFWRSPKSGRWWVEVPDGRFTSDNRHRLVSCSYEDYVEASQRQTLPDRLLTAFRRYA